ncbi:uncharacterized protein FOMMEDRAFT_127732 [Fomitiporia mediterranea MF3/22]|uniref:uncharacterized protein n=1 Tax=Fomitiporia mediterranea (strain MF3/22) TaxID=694068 RepID=UPI0004409B0D|nr:uncharacterized protein FOMMEDRAFT_127732 [Fomitiporia mediterranea MF3/22]EJD00235.1 hypothetical protein FOMMEDRAFT_127732 [Fomitiporia mediterranea MF3/22]
MNTSYDSVDTLVNTAMVNAHSNQVAIFWDFENCRPPSNISGTEVVEKIRSLVQYFGRIITFKAYADVSLIFAGSKSNNLQSELQSSGLTLVHCPHNGRKDVADKMMIVDMLAFVIDRPQTTTIVIITGDRDFTYAAGVLKLRGYRIIVIATMHNAHSSLKLQADYLFDWNKDVLDEANSGVVLKRLKADNLRPSGAPSSGVALHPRRESTPSTIAVSESAMEKWELLATSQDEPAVEEDLRSCCRASPTFDGSSSSSDISFEEIGEDFPEETWLDVSSAGRSGNGRNANRVPNSPRFQPCKDQIIDVPARPSAVPAPSLERSESALISPVDFEMVSVWSATDDGWMTPRSDRSFELDAEDMGPRDLVPSKNEGFDSGVLRSLDSPSAHLDGNTSNFVDPASRKPLLPVHESNDEERVSAIPPLILTDAASHVSVGVETQLSSLHDAADVPSQPTEVTTKDILDAPDPDSNSENSSSSVSLSAKDVRPSGPSGAISPSASSVPAPSRNAGCIATPSQMVSKATTIIARPSPDTAAVQRFQTIVSYFRERRASDGATRICTSEFAQELLKRDPKMYKKAGVSRLKRFLEEAEKSFVVFCSDWEAGSAWVEINPCLYPDTRSPQSSRDTVTLAIVKPETASKADSTMSVDAVYRPLVDCLNTRGTHCLTYTAAGVALLGIHPNLYKEAGTSSLSTYLEKAEKQGIVRLGSIRGPGTEWVELLPAFHNSLSLSLTI